MNSRNSTPACSSSSVGTDRRDVVRMQRRDDGPETGVGHHLGFGKRTVLLHRGIVRVHLRLSIGLRDARVETGDHPERTAA